MISILLSLFVSFSYAQTIKVAVIDTGFDQKSTWEKAKATGFAVPSLCKEGSKTFTGPDIQDTNGHGTHIAGLIAKYAEDADHCLVILKYYQNTNSSMQNLISSNLALREAIDQKVDIINYSGGGISYDSEECSLVREALDKGIVFVSAAGNEGLNLRKFRYYPAMCDRRVVIVENTTKDGSLAKSSNFFEPQKTTDEKDYFFVREKGVDIKSILPNNQVGFMTGTSQSTAIVTGKLVKSMWISRRAHETSFEKVADRKK